MNEWFKALLALVMWREASGEPVEGIRAVGHVIANRVAAKWGNWDAVITAKNQFSSMTVKGDPNTVRYPLSSDPSWHTCLDAAAVIFEGTDPDNTQGALYYENPAIATSGWFVENIRNNPTQHPVKLTVGHHVFYT